MKGRFFIYFLLIGVMLGTISACRQKANGTEDISGKEIYRKNCRLCHGADGTLGLSGAADLSRSALKAEDVKRVIRNGRRTMQAFSKTLSEAEIDSVAAYVMQLRK